MKISEKIWKAWEIASLKQKIEALCEMNVQVNGLYARLWLNIDKEADRIIWATIDASVNENIAAYNDDPNIIFLYGNQTAILDDFGEAESLEEYVKKYVIPQIENDIIYNPSQIREWDRE